MTYIKITDGDEIKAGITIGSIFKAKPYPYDSGKLTLLEKVSGPGVDYEPETFNHYRCDCEVLSQKEVEQLLYNGSSAQVRTQTIEHNRCTVELCNGETYDAKVEYVYSTFSGRYDAGPSHILLNGKWVSMFDAEEIDESFSCYGCDNYRTEASEPAFLLNQFGGVEKIIGGALLPYELELTTTPQGDKE